MTSFENYILRTRGCVLPVADEEDRNNINTAQINSSSISLHCRNWSNCSISEQTKKLVEIRFKNDRKDIYENFEGLFLKIGDIVAVEAQSGHDIGIVNLIGDQMFWQLKKYPATEKYPKIYRKAKLLDLEKWERAVMREEIILNRTKEIITDLSLNMKLGDIEFQGDGAKATFYYTAEERVDFRELIKILASEFKIRIEMRQIGARQESAKIGGIGTCGHKICCVEWKRDFDSVTTNSARVQELSLNPTKLAGQCSKLKCCLNYEVDAYIEARRNFPDTSVILQTKQGEAYFQKSDVFKKILWYSFDQGNSVNITALTINRVEEIIELNKKSKIPDTLLQNNLELADLISTKHNIKISKEEIEKDNEEPQINHKNKNKKKKNNYYKKKNKQNRNNKKE